MVFNDCGGCTKTCDNPNPMCMAVCVTGCACTSALPLWDSDQQACIAESACPKPNQCDATIGENYLDTSTVKTACADNADGAECKGADCITNKCVPARNFIPGDADDRICEKFSKSVCGSSDPSDPKKLAAKCQWAYDGNPPIFVCTGAADGGVWALSQQGTCNTQGTVAAEVCDYLMSSDCFALAKCDDRMLPQCTALVKTTVASCKIPCFNTGPGKSEACSDCWLETMFTTRTINDEEPDIETCCGCLDEAFAPAGVTADNLGTILASACTGDEYGEYAYYYDDAFAYEYYDDDY